MRITKATLHEAAEEAFRVVWWFRTNPANPEAVTFLEEVEAGNPPLFLSLDREDGTQMLRWEGRLATLRNLAYEGGEGHWDGEGAFDS